MHLNQQRNFHLPYSHTRGENIPPSLRIGIRGYSVTTLASLYCYRSRKAHVEGEGGELKALKTQLSYVLLSPMVADPTGSTEWSSISDGCC